ncbi:MULTISPECIES: xanthine dehydrogenase family protein molybdopterin-binding subunit [Sphingobium]|uniref:xanthine dehydrogenase family protein molybdopterin-binding subunit n=1 Tax=Sphingobium TaxID=165695 RepID=UPI0028B1CA08|nr:xanthine dehydrogenase family protein molybdopterin-binding subunit [Sphingobium yanoikuyae]
MAAIIAHDGIGAPLSRVEGLLKVTGKARYAAEYPATGLLHGVVVNAAIARGRITRIDDSAARAVAGVVDVLTHENRLEIASADKKFQDDVAPPGSPLRPLCDAQIHYNGQPVALVVAETFEAARYAASLVELGYEQDAHNTRFEVALAEKFVPRKKRSGYYPPKNRGDARSAFETAPVTIAGDYHKGAEHHNPMEMHASTVFFEGDGRLTVHDKTQGPQNVQAYLAGAFDLKADDVRVLNPFVGGAFGSGLRPQYNVYLAAMAALKLKRSVRVVLTRQQMFTHTHRPECLNSISLGAERDGALTAILTDATTLTSRFENYMETVVNWGMMNYACENAEGASFIAPVDTYTPGDMRAPGAATGMTQFEMAMDELSYAVGIDPLDLRVKNYSNIDAMNGTEFTSKALREAYAQGAQAFGWDRRSPQPRSMREGKELIGWGMATGMWDAMFSKCAARATLKTDGTLEVASAMSDIGTGTYTVMTQVAADTLGLPASAITAKLGDSTLPLSPVEGGSWGAASVGAAVQLACHGVAARLAKAAAKMDGDPLEGAKLDDLLFENGTMRRRDGKGEAVLFTAAMEAAALDRIEVEKTARPGPLDMVSLIRKSRNTHSAVFCEVRVDEELGVVRVTRVVSAIAAGRIINPKTARSQILGGVVMGIGAALHEESFLDHRLGRFMNHNYAEYHVPAHADIHDIEVIFVHEPDPEVTPLGVKGLGEIGIVGTAAAVANAIYHATGVRVRSLPVTIDKLLVD